MTQISRAILHKQVYFFGICLLAISLPVSRYFMSISQLILLANWLAEMNFNWKFRKVISNKPVLVFLIIIGLHFAGLIFTTNFSYAADDLRTKMPLLLLPVVFTTMPALSRTKIRTVLILFAGSAFVASVISLSIFFSGNYNDIREISPFISHIRLNLNICYALAILAFFVFRSEWESSYLKWGAIPMGISMVVFVVVSESFTGILILLITGIVFLLTEFWRQRKQAAGLVMLGILIGGLTWLVITVLDVTRPYLTPVNETKTKLDTISREGNYYLNDTTSHLMVEGHYLRMYICEPELKREWEKRSPLLYQGTGYNGFTNRDILIRYLTSKGLRKDATGMNALSNRELRLIENGVADYMDAQQTGFRKRLRALIWEYQDYLCSGNSNGHSLMLRFEYWKASVSIIRQHWLTGVGTGDMNEAFHEYYQNSQTRLLPEWQRRSHNQFLSITVGFGIPGLLLFLVALFYPPIRKHRLFHFLFGFFFLILLISMMNEDTIESQDGVTFAAFFYTFLIFGIEDEALDGL